MDMYPFAESMVIITDPGVAMQVQNSPNFSRHPFSKKYLRGLVGTKSLFSTEGVEWQRQRSWFSPAFSMTHLLTLIPGMVKETLVFKENLVKFAVSGETFKMGDETSQLAIDIIGRTIGDIRLKSQSEYSPVRAAIASTLRWTAGHTDPTWKKIVSPYMMSWYTSKLDHLLGNLIKEKYKNRRENGLNKSILDLALRGYLKDNGKLGAEKMERADLDEDFMRIALDK